MNPEHIPEQSLKSLINACIVAFFLALVILFVAVLPAEYGIDPTGLGKKMGLIALSKSSQKTTPSSAETNAVPTKTAEENAGPIVADSSGDVQALDASKPIQWKDTVKIVIPPKKGLEYKFALVKGAVLEYTWTTDGIALYFDFHGEPKGAKDGYFKSYLNIMDKESKGMLTAPFEGIHGWYWENDTNKPVTIQLSTNGVYQILGVLE
jgi:hypothetical protein